MSRIKGHDIWVFGSDKSRTLSAAKSAIEGLQDMYESVGVPEPEPEYFCRSLCRSDSTVWLDVLEIVPTEVFRDLVKGAEYRIVISTHALNVKNLWSLLFGVPWWILKSESSKETLGVVDAQDIEQKIMTDAGTFSRHAIKVANRLKIDLNKEPLARKFEDDK